MIKRRTSSTRLWVIIRFPTFFYHMDMAQNFPAYLMYKAAVDNDVIDLIRPLVNKGIRPESISKLLLELDSEKYHRDF